MPKLLPTLIISSILILSCVVVPAAVAQEMSAADKMDMADDAASLAVKRAAEARARCNPAFLRGAVESIRQAATLVSEAVIEAENTGRLALAQEAYGMATNIVGQGIGFIREVCMHCTRGGTDAAAVARFKKSCSAAAAVQKLNDQTIEGALAAGAIPPREDSGVSQE
jgi:hypothetical protein